MEIVVAKFLLHILNCDTFFVLIKQFKMNRIYLFLLLIFVVFSCSNYYDKGKEYQIVESETTTEFQKLKFEESIICKECHETIYDEFMTSMHSKSSIYQDAIFKAVWEKHPNFLEEKQFNCAQCHTPAADNLVDFMSSELKQFPNKNNASQNEGVSCAVCHRIESIEQHRTANRNIYIEDTHTYYGISTGMSHSHQSNNENDLYFNGQVCKGCHSHRENSEGYLIDITESESENKWQTCVTCHMPLTPGTGTFKKMDRKHMNHSFPGAHVSPGMLSEHIVFSAKNIESQLEISVKNKAPHDLFIQAFRIAYLKVSIIENDKIIKEFEPIVL